MQTPTQWTEYHWAHKCLPMAQLAPRECAVHERVLATFGMALATIELTTIDRALGKGRGCTIT